MEGSSSYTSLYIFNRLLSSTVTDGTNTAGLASYTYDGKAPVNVTGMTAHDPAYTTSFLYRGNPSTVSTPTNTVTLAYDIGGNTTSSNNNGVGTSSTIGASTNYAAPSTLTTNSLSTSLSYSSFLGVTHATGPNGATASVIYDASARPSSTTSPSGAGTSLKRWIGLRSRRRHSTTPIGRSPRHNRTRQSESSSKTALASTAVDTLLSSGALVRSRTWATW